MEILANIAMVAVLALVIAICVAGIFAVMYMAFKPIIDDQNRRIQESKRRNPRAYGHLDDKLFPWDKD